MITRRNLVLSGAASVSLSGCSLLSSPQSRDGRLTETRGGNRDIVLTATERNVAIGAKPARLWLYGEAPFPVLRMTKGEALSVTLRNGLREHTSIHWHGVRGPNAMDGVPYLTQMPVQPGEEFAYRLTPPDAGTFFFHPHCNTVEQLGRGLLGALIVEEGDPAFDDDVVLILKDWRLDDNGQFLPFLTTHGASQAGTFGTLRTINGIPAPRIRTHARVRMRLINADPTRISQIGVEGADARIIAIDGNPVTPFALDSWRFGPGMRLDLAIDGRGANEFRLVDYFAASPVVLATLDSASARDGGERAASKEPSPPPDFSGVSPRTLELGAGVDANSVPDSQPIVLPDGRTIDLTDSLCLASGTFWTLDGKAWPDRDHKSLPPPLFSFRRGEPVVIELVNTTSRAHPIHIHGHTMSVLSMSLLRRPVHRADTVLVLPNERVTVGFVADNPGNWMIHCHIIEHQETGMMGWFHVS
jgi:FtsP/CotA-like multicopper oxidase with cupredoxin domain